MLKIDANLQIEIVHCYVCWVLKNILEKEFGVGSFDAKNCGFEFDYQKMNMFEFIQRLKW